MTIADKFFQTRMITRKATKKSYNNSFRKYCSFTSMSLEELLEEAETEEEERIPIKRRKIKAHLLDFQNMLSTKYRYNTVKTDVNNIKTFYRTNEIELPYLPRIRVVSSVATTYKEILTKDEIRYLLESTTNMKFKAMCLFILSSGTAIQETTNLTVGDFLEATREYHNTNDIHTMIQELKNKDNVIPTFFIIRIKKSRPYYTFCSPEATSYIVKYLEQQMFVKELSKDTPLFYNTVPGAISTFIRINDKCGFPRKKNGIRKFHSHSLRKYFSTRLGEAGMNKEDINFLSGRKPDIITDAYFQIKPEVRLQRYKRYLKVLTIFDEVNYVDITSQEKEHYEKLKEDIKQNKVENQEIKQMLYDLKKLL